MKAGKKEAIEKFLIKARIVDLKKRGKKKNQISYIPTTSRLVDYQVQNVFKTFKV